MATTPVQGWTVPDGTQAPSKSAFSTLAGQAELQSVMVFADAAARDAKIAAGARKAGMLAYLKSPGRFSRVMADGGAWSLLGEDFYTGTEAAFIGASPPAGVPIQRRSFRAVLPITGGSSGVGSLTLPVAAPNGITGVTVTNTHGAGLHTSFLVEPTSTLAVLTIQAYNVSAHTWVDGPMWVSVGYEYW